MFVVYKKLTKKKLKANAKELLEGATKFFENNPKRRICRAEVWYGKVVRIPRGKVKETIDKVVKEELAKL